MSDIVIISGQTAARQSGSVRMSYSLGHKQPVLCTIVRNDPYFFDIDPEALADEFDASLSLEGARFDVPEALQTARTTSDGFITLGDGAEGLPLTDDMAALCRDALSPAASFDMDNVHDLIAFSSTARALLDQAISDGISVKPDASAETASFDPEARIVRINPSLSLESAALVLMRECRAAALVSVLPQLANPDRAILINRAMHAELNGIMIQIAWELNLAGHKQAWQLISESAMADQVYAFGGRAAEDFRALRDGRAAIAAFDQWFYSGRTRQADRSLIQALLAASAAENAAEKTFTAMDTINALRSIGDRGIGRNYLLDHVATLLEDGFYGEVRDRSNANFLWFVKFERSYRAAEEIVEGKKASPVAGNAGIVLSFPNIMRKQARKGRKAKCVAAIVPLTARR